MRCNSTRTTDKDGLYFEKPFTISKQDRNLALNKPATSSGIEGALVAGRAVDGNLGSRWGSAWSDDQWLQVDLGNVYSVTRVVLKWESVYGKEYKIQTSKTAMWLRVQVL